MSEPGEVPSQRPITGEFKIPDKPLSPRIRMRGRGLLQNLASYHEFHDSPFEGKARPLRLQFDIERHIPKGKLRSGFRYSAMIDLREAPDVPQNEKAKTLTREEFAEKMRKIEGFEEVDGYYDIDFVNSINGILVNWSPPSDGGGILLGVIHTTPLESLSEVTGTIAPELARLFNLLSPEVKISDEGLQKVVERATSVGNDETLLPVGSR